MFSILLDWRHCTQRRASCSVAVFDQSSPWGSCAFTNYVQGTVGKGAGARPTSQMWGQEQDPFLKLLEKLRPHRIIVLSKTAWSKMPERKMFRHEDLQAFGLADGSLVWAKAMVHPCARNSLPWQTYAKAFAQFNTLQLPAKG